MSPSMSSEGFPDRIGLIRGTLNKMTEFHQEDVSQAALQKPVSGTKIKHFMVWVYLNEFWLRGSR